MPCRCPDPAVLRSPALCRLTVCYAIRSYLSYRTSVRAEARMLIDRYREESVKFSRDTAFAAMRDGADLDRAWHLSAMTAADWSGKISGYGPRLLIRSVQT